MNHLGAFVIACGGIASVIGRGHTPQYVPPTEEQIAADLPFASTEQVLVIHDAASKAEHLVMELRFDKADKSFGILIPVPSAPSAVEKVAHSPFSSLRDIYVFTPEGFGIGVGRGLTGIGPNLGGQGAGMGGGQSAATPPVEVLDEHPMGSFTSFTLAVHDAHELGTWLDAHDFAAPKALSACAETYARMDFSFVALKYASDADAGASGLTSETLRISFATPQPYFPYSEPVASKSSKRLLSAWVIASDASRPIATHAGGIAQPWRAGQRATASHDELALVLKDLASVIPSGDKLVVQTYRDWKTSRDGWGDVIFVPEKPTPLDDAAKMERARLIGLLDTTLVPPPRPRSTATDLDASAAPSASVTASAIATPTAPVKSSGGCSASGDDSPSASLWILALVLLARGCAKQPPTKTDEASTPIASASASASASIEEHASASLPVDPARALAAYAILSGELPEAGVAVIAGIVPVPPPPHPEANVRVGNLTTRGPLDSAIIQRIVRRSLPAIRYCYESGLLQRPGLSGDAQVQIAIGPNGDVVSANVSFPDSSVQSCVTGRFRSMQFPTASALTVATVRIIMRFPD